MSEKLPRLDDIVSEVLARAAAVDLLLEGPAETEYGYGWYGAISLWSGNRRVHFCLRRDPTFYILEMAEIFPGQLFQRGKGQTDSDVRLKRITSTEEAWVAVEAFLRQGCSLDQLPGDGWYNDSGDYDKFIPHPPDRANPANIVWLTKQPGFRPWKPSKPQNKRDA